MNNAYPEIQNALAICCSDANIQLDDVRRVLELSRETLDLDLLFVSTNVRYKYLLEHLITCYRDKTGTHQDYRLELSEESYRALVDSYLDTPLLETPISSLDSKNLPGSILHTAITRNNEYFGTIGFYSTQERVWTNSEKELIQSLKLLLLVFLGFTSLSHTSEKHDLLALRAQSNGIKSCYYLDLVTGNCHTIKLAPSLQGLITEWMPYDNLVSTYTQHYVNPDYAKTMVQNYSLENLRATLNNCVNYVSFVFPRTVNNTTNWMRYSAETIETDTKGKPLSALILMEDIDEEKNKEARIREMSASLMQEHELVLQKEAQLTIDPLTGAYNRMGLDAAIADCKKSNESVGVLMIDIDHFKKVNDSYGHEYGDEILKIVAEQLRGIFRNEDKLFRIGGDEFVMLLYGCGMDSWESIQDKVAAIHYNLKSLNAKDFPLTLSIGFAVSTNGYQDNLQSLADEALYHTKNNGRAGLTQIGLDRAILGSWHDASTEKGVSAQQGIGHFRIEYSANKTLPPRLFLDEAAHVLLGIPGTLTAEECFRRFFMRIPARYSTLFQEMRDKVITTGETECTFLWGHPTQGEIRMRSGSRFSKNGDSEEIYGYVMSLENTSIVFNHNDAQFLMQAMNSIYYCSYYINLNSRDYYIVKGHENEPDVNELHHNIDQRLDDFVSNMVSPDYRKQVSAFCDLGTLPERFKGKKLLECEYLSLMEHGWCRSRFLPVKWDAEGNLTHVSLSSCSIEKNQN